MAVNKIDRSSKKLNKSEGGNVRGGSVHRRSGVPQEVSTSSVEDIRYQESRRWVLIALTIVAVLELLIYRTFSRVGVFIPKEGERMATFRTVYEISVQVGTIVLNFSVMLAVLALVLTIMRFRQSGEFAATVVANQRAGINGQARNRMLTIALIASMVVIGMSVALLWLVQNEFSTTTLRVALLVAFGTLTVDMWLRSKDWRWRLFAILLFVGYFCQIVAKLLHDTILPWLGLNLTEVIYLPMLDFGELLVLINGVVAFLCFVRPGQLSMFSIDKTNYGGQKPVSTEISLDEKINRGQSPLLQLKLFREVGWHWLALVGAIGLAGVFLGLTFLTVAETYIVPILGLYGLGYAMHWPLALYAIALFFIFYTIFYSLGRWQTHKAIALGLILILTGGYIFNISEQYLFALVGVLLLARPEILSNE